MNDYENYKRARNAAWQILIDCNIDRLPICVNQICHHYGWRLVSYKRGRNTIEKMGLGDIFDQTDGFCIVRNGQYYIFYDDTMPHTRQRFTIAHEIGHIILGHVREGQYTRVNREPDSHDDPAETQANQIAARILAPACILHSIQVITAEDIAKVCDISMTAAQFRARRMSELERRNMYLAHPLERRVAAQFRSYIRGVFLGGRQ